MITVFLATHFDRTHTRLAVMACRVWEHRQRKHHKKGHTPP